MSLYHYPLVGLPSNIKPLSFHHWLVNSLFFFIFCYSCNLSLLLPSSLISFYIYSFIFLIVCHRWFAIFTLLKTCLSLSLFFTPPVVPILLKSLTITSTTQTTPIAWGVYSPMLVGSKDCIPSSIIIVFYVRISFTNLPCAPILNSFSAFENDLYAYTMNPSTIVFTKKSIM
jgi:hypothetical protein